ncbi:MAG: hypothetical protein SNJ57_11900 [Cyanobacteriota bacterium]
MQPLEKLLEHVNQQRVKHIIKLYALDREETQDLYTCLDALFRLYPPPLIELALVETLVDHWAAVPMPRGLAFMSRVRDRLRHWETQWAAQEETQGNAQGEHQQDRALLFSTLTPQQFHHITGLDPAPIFGPGFVEVGGDRPAHP